MGMGDITVRQESETDLEAIDKVNRITFGSRDEANFVSAIRKTLHFIPELSLVAERDGAIVGHCLLFQGKLMQEEGETAVLVLAPMAVMPAQAGRGIGTELIQAIISKAEALGFSGIIEVGKPDYFAKYGFKPIADWNIECPLAVPTGMAQVLELVPGALKEGGLVKYPGDFVSLFSC